MRVNTASEAARAVQFHTRTYAALHRDVLERDHWGSSALMHDGEVIGVFTDGAEACDAGIERFGQGNFGIKHIGIASIGYLTVRSTD